MHPLVTLAKDTVEAYVREGKVPAPRIDELPPECQDRAGVFVCLKIHGLLRGCIGTFEPQASSIAEETVRNAVSAATCDPRFSPVRAAELGEIEYTVDVLTPPERIPDADMLDPLRYGVIVKAGGRRGLLLPDLEGVDRADQQIGIAMQKAGIPSGSAIELFRFEVKRYH